jgi:uncharacterized protein YggE
MVSRALAVIGVAAGMSAAGAGIASASPVAGPRAQASTITVTGTGTAAGTPDELQVSLEASATAAAVSDALDQASQAMTQIKGALAKDGVADADLQTTDMSVQPQYNQQGKVTGYSVSESLNAELRGLDKAGQEISDAVHAGGNAARVDTVQLDLTDQSAKLLARARTQAIDDAKARASQYAQAAGRSLGPVLTITENSASVPFRPLPAVGAMFAANSAVPISAGTQKVTANVTVVYQLG